MALMGMSSFTNRGTPMLTRTTFGNTSWYGRKFTVCLSPQGGRYTTLTELRMITDQKIYWAWKVESIRNSSLNIKGESRKSKIN